MHTLFGIIDTPQIALYRGGGILISIDVLYDEGQMTGRGQGFIFPPGGNMIPDNVKFQMPHAGWFIARVLEVFNCDSFDALHGQRCRVYKSMWNGLIDAISREDINPSEHPDMVFYPQMEMGLIPRK